MKTCGGDSKEKSIVALALAVEAHDALYDRCDRPDPVALALGGTAVTGLAVAAGKLRTGSDKTRVEFTLVRSFCREKHEPTLSIIPLDTEEEVLYHASALFARLGPDWLFTWAGDEFEIPFLRLKGFMQGNRLAWLPAAEQSMAGSPGTVHFGLHSLLFAGASKRALSQMMAELNFAVPDHIGGIERLELYAVGTFALAVRSVWQSGLLDDSAYKRSIDDFSRGLDGQALLQPHFALWSHTTRKPDRSLKKDPVEKG